MKQTGAHEKLKLIQTNMISKSSNVNQSANLIYERANYIHQVDKFKMIRLIKISDHPTYEHFV